MSATPEIRELTLGFIALTDCAPLVAAQARGLFAEEGLQVTLSREASWANIRDKVASGALAGAHMLAPMALASAAGAGGGAQAPMIAPMSLNANGSSVVLSRELAARLRASGAQSPEAGGDLGAAPLRRLIQARAAAGEGPLTFAVVFPFSIHNYLLRYWLAEAGIDPDRDVRMTVIPPPRMAARMQAGAVDGLCVGAPWGAVIEAEGAGEIWVQNARLWPDAPDKVLGLGAGWAHAHPATLQALLRALIRAARWADEPANHPALAALLARPEHVGAPEDRILRALREPPGLRLRFPGPGAGRPRRDQALWLMSQMRRWGQIDASVDLDAAAGVYRPDLYAGAAAEIGLDPTFPEAALAPLFDGRRFDPAAVDAYLEALPRFGASAAG